MVSGASSPLTKLSFRRDVRLFLASLVGLLVFLIAALLIGFWRTSNAAAERTLAQWNTAADAAVDVLRSAEVESLPPQIIEAHLNFIRGRYAIAALTLTRGRSTITSGMTTDLTPVARPVGGGTLTCWFDGAPLRDARRTFVLLAGLTVAATTLGVILLLLYLPRITRPIEVMLDEAAHVSDRPDGQEDTQYVVETFRSSVAELRRIHELQKTRADDLERVSAALTRSIPSGFLSIDRDGRILEVNAAARDIVALPESIQGSTIEDALGTNDFSSMLQSAFGSRQALTRAEAGIDVAAEHRVIGLTTVPLMNEQGDFLGMLALFTDLTPFRDLEARVREMKNLADLGEMAAGIAHEFRNSLATVTGYLSLAQRDDIPDATRQRIANASSEAAQLSAAVQSFLAFARPMELHLERIDLRTTVDAVVEAIRTQASDVALTVRGGSSMVDADAVLLARAVDNLVRNALDAVRDAGRTDGAIAVTVDSDPPAVTIEDNGEGVDPADVPRLFLPFQSTRSAGFGLGLSLVRKIVLLHGGEVTLTGAPGQGARARMTFPPA